jgi:redox-sensing transcriptional repressor
LAEPRAGERLSRAAAHRLSLYLRVLAAWPADAGKISSGRIAEACGNLGQRGLGYKAADLAAAIRAALGIDRTWRALLVGVGNLARALLRYRGFRAQGFEIVALFDNDESKIGQNIEGLTVESIAALAERLPALGAELAVLTVPAESAHAVAEILVDAGIKGILNFAPVLLKVPTRVKLVTVDLAIQLEQLAFLIQLGDPEPRDEGVP